VASLYVEFIRVLVIKQIATLAAYANERLSNSSISFISKSWLSVTEVQR